MKRYFILLITVILIFALTGCSNADDFNELRMEVTENNKKVENIIHRYSDNKSASEKFDKLFISNFTSFGEYDKSINSFSPNRDIVETISYVQDILLDVYMLREKDVEVQIDFFKGLEDSIHSYPMMNEVNGSIEEIIYIQGANMYFIFYWEDNHIVNYEYQFIG